MKPVESQGFQNQPRRELSTGSVQRALTHRSTRTLPLRVTFLHNRSDFSSLTFRAASAAPVNSIRYAL